MSTYYGYGCETCGYDSDGRIRETMIISNFRDPNPLVDILKCETVTDLIKVDYAAELARSYNLFEALRFVADHRARQHVVRVCNEYGEWLDSCRNSLRCRCCGVSTRSCALKDGHAGPCLRRELKE